MTAGHARVRFERAAGQAPDRGHAAISGQAEHLVAIDALPSAQSGSFAIHQWDTLQAGDAAAARAAVEARMAA
jgi:hypothetical protein